MINSHSLIPEINRIKGLPSRELITSVDQAQKATKFFTKEVKSCKCESKWGYCIKELKPIQAAALSEAFKMRGLFAPIGVGHGKTGIDILLPMMLKSKVAVLLLPPSLVTQFVTRDYPQWSVHFETPNLITDSNKLVMDGRPQLYVISYSQLSLAKNTGLLSKIQPDLIIADEAHKLRAATSARNKRVFRYIDERRKQGEQVDFCVLSGTLMKNSIKDFAHLSKYTHGKNSPMPIPQHDIFMWVKATDTKSVAVTPLGELKALAPTHEALREVIRTRIQSTPGVVHTSDKSVGSSLKIQELGAVIPDNVRDMLNKIQVLGQNPQGDEAESVLEIALWQKHLTQGFYHYFDFSGISPDVANRWFEARKKYNKEVREKLSQATEGMDSPLLLAQANERWKKGIREGNVWNSKHRQEWLDVREMIDIDKIRHTAWVSDYFVTNIVSEIAKTPNSIVWVDSVALGQKLSEVTKLPYYHFSTQNIEGEKGNRAVIASISSCSEGKNLQYSFSKNIVTCPPSCALRWDQMIGRTLRQGQEEDEVHIKVYTHAECYANAFENARKVALTNQKTLGTQNALLIADYVGTELD